MAAPTADHPSGLAFRLQRAAVVAGMALAAVNLWTGAPLLALWVGSRIQGGGGVAMGAVFGAMAVLAVTLFCLVRLLGVLGARHDALIGAPPRRRRQQPWMRPLSGERNSELRKRQRLSVLDVVLVATVVLAVGAFEVWFFFLSGSSLPAGT